MRDEFGRLSPAEYLPAISVVMMEAPVDTMYVWFLVVYLEDEETPAKEEGSETGQGR